MGRYCMCHCMDVQVTFKSKNFEYVCAHDIQIFRYHMVSLPIAHDSEIMKKLLIFGI